MNAFLRCRRGLPARAHNKHQLHLQPLLHRRNLLMIGCFADPSAMRHAGATTVVTQFEFCTVGLDGRMLGDVRCAEIVLRYIRLAQNACVMVIAI
jgi:hypothetical protein